jgi:hypothetical protein
VTLTPSDLLILCMAALFALGFEALVRASPLGKIRMKPFNCRTCLAGWGAILFFLGLHWLRSDPLMGWKELLLFVVKVLAATGAAKIVQRAQPLRRREDVQDEELPPVDP